ncbi:D-sedoheptulose 7-phosphate isomerase [Streptomyces sp. Ag109_O5-1]|uniref:D-sedoheptulose-7-phosphate isomerase n=1 Tax=Streptomyces sp. Ag109_O5-1 TaxID=1938851 RepID=UPI000FA81C91|nr:SIS domain-containing protein [Streptomyces sp. Ag109_O5-1]RPE39962.1 D-sedoheptulose 7-phosphate isomerase [Streptomyces sp. Ag109_O5-1]
MPTDQANGGNRQLESYLGELARALALLDRSAVTRYAEQLGLARAEGRQVFLLGNGGSSATASHHVTDLLKTSAVPDCAPLRAFCLSDSTPLTTAIANDIAYEEVFAYQLAAYARPGDLVVALSCSGTSPNVVRAGDMARRNGQRLVALTGDTAAGVAPLADLHIRVASSNHGVIEDVHMTVCHAASQLLRADLERQSVRPARDASPRREDGPPPQTSLVNVPEPA